MPHIVQDKNILSYIKKFSKASIGDMCAEFKISESTVRRSLSRLESAGYISRYKGGAIAVVTDKTEYNYRLSVRREQKNFIARKAAENIEENAVVILLGGTTVSLMCSYLCGRKLTVITNSLPVVEQLKESPDITIVMLGGIYNREEREFYGNITTIGLRLMYADSLFMSCRGFSPGIGYMTDEIDSVDFYKLCMKNAGKTYMLADSSKSGRSEVAIVAATGEIGCIITDSGISERDIAEFTAEGVEVILT